MFDLNNIYNQDCLQGMASIPDGSVDMILCDLPYGITACEWDVIIPFEPLWAAYKRIIKSNGAIVLTASQPFTTDLINSNRKWFKQELIWEKDIATGFLNANRMILKAHENILLFSNKATIFNPQYKTGKPYKIVSGKHKDNSVTSNKKITSGGYKTTNNGKRYPTSVLKINTEKGFHPTQKPVKLFEYLIRTYTNEGETVLDNCMGSGTTAIACIRSNRQFIGFETEKKYFDMANKRIENELSKQRLFV